MATIQTRNARLELRLSGETNSLLQQAADAVGKNLSEFVIDSARHEAVDVMADRRVFLLDEQQMAAFEAALDRPVQGRRALKALLATEPIFQ